MPHVAILVANYNYGNYIEETIASVHKAQEMAAQLCEQVNICMLVGDDKSTDNSLEAIGNAKKRYQNSNFQVKVFAFSENRKPNAVITDLVHNIPDNCTHTVILDADDRLKETAI
ncbi:MAG: glycosyltransferase [Hyphomicrobiales bacterium]|nr:glycosyltransferase [Hyphomicrobiales bacterium]